MNHTHLLGKETEAKITKVEFKDFVKLVFNNNFKFVKPCYTFKQPKKKAK